MTALDTAGHAVVFSGFAVAIGLGGLLFFRGSFLATMGFGGSDRRRLLAVALRAHLPAGACWWRSARASMPARLPMPRVAAFDGGWHRIATWVMRRPVLVLLPTLGRRACCSARRSSA